MSAIRILFVLVTSLVSVAVPVAVPTTSLTLETNETSTAGNLVTQTPVQSKVSKLLIGPDEFSCRNEKLYFRFKITEPPPGKATDLLDTNQTLTTEQTMKFDNVSNAPTVENRPEATATTAKGTPKEDEMMADQPNMSLTQFQRDEARGG